jgi:divalent metal cation (Fe/Co/Zn/Cd) transporter
MGGEAQRMSGHSSTRRTVLIAGAANLFVGVIKLVAGVLAGSSAMLAEAAHSAADTLNQAFLLASLRRGERPADPRHPFGYGQEPSAAPARPVSYFDLKNPGGSS